MGDIDYLIVHYQGGYWLEFDVLRFTGFPSLYYSLNQSC